MVYWTIMDPNEKLWGIPHRASQYFDFINTMEASGLSDIGFVGPRYTWCNNRNLVKEYGKDLIECLYKN